MIIATYRGWMAMYSLCSVFYDSLFYKEGKKPFKAYFL
jgi:hypothetical protein